jgi:hypothetical protein
LSDNANNRGLVNVADCQFLRCSATSSTSEGGCLYAVALEHFFARLCVIECYSVTGLFLRNNLRAGVPTCDFVESTFYNCDSTKAGASSGNLIFVLITRISTRDVNFTHIKSGGGYDDCCILRYEMYINQGNNPCVSTFGIIVDCYAGNWGNLLANKYGEVYEHCIYLRNYAATSWFYIGNTNMSFRRCLFSGNTGGPVIEGAGNVW